MIHFSVDGFVDIVYLFFIWWLFIPLSTFKFNALPLRRRLVVLGFCGNIFTLSTSIICFTIFITHYQQDRIQLLYYINAHVC